MVRYLVVCVSPTLINYDDHDEERGHGPLQRDHHTEDDKERRGGGIVEAQPIPDSSPGRDDDVKRRKGGRLSLVSQQYDIDGDGQLDKAEFASESVKPVLSCARH